MTKLSFIFLVMFLGVLGELLLGSWGIVLPISAILVFYITISYDWHYGLFVSIVGGGLIDMLFGRSFIITPFSLSFITFVAVLWGILELHLSESVLLHIIPGGFLAFCYLMPLLAINVVVSDFRLWSLWNNTANLVFCVLACSVLLPLIIIILDSVSRDLDLNLYVQKNKK